MAHARRANERLRYGDAEIYGISVFAAVDEVGDASLDGLLSGRLGTHRLVHLSSARILAESGFRLMLTFNRPHFTVVLDSVHESVVRRLHRALGPARANPYHVPTRRRSGR